MRESTREGESECEYEKDICIRPSQSTMLKAKNSLFAHAAGFVKGNSVGEKCSGRLKMQYGYIIQRATEFATRQKKLPGATF